LRAGFFPTVGDYGDGSMEVASEDDLLLLALDEARRAMAHGDVPVGAVAAVAAPSNSTGLRVIAQRHNERELQGDPTAHAEVLALRQAARAAGNYRVTGATLYATVEPCPMCCGAILHARIGRVVYGAVDPKAGAVVSLYRLLDDSRLNHRVEARGGVLADESARLLRAFFAAKR